MKKMSFDREKKSYTIAKPVCVLSESEKGKQTKEFNLVIWDDRGPMYDIRRWEGGIPGRGISLTQKEAVDLYFALGEELLKSLR